MPPLRPLLRAGTTLGAVPHDAAHAPAPATRDERRGERATWVAVRFLLGAMLLWAFLDKLLGLGYPTPASRSWLAGASPTAGFLDRTAGPAAGVFQGISGHPAVDALFMMGLLLIGASLLLGIGLRVAGWSGALLFGLMWAASMPGPMNPLLDQHLVYAVLLLGMTTTGAGDAWGLGRWWARQPLVRRHAFLR